MSINTFLSSTVGLFSGKVGVGSAGHRAFVIASRGHSLRFYGGPFRDAFVKAPTPGYFLVKMAAEQQGYADVTVAVHDFRAPDPEALRLAVIAGIKAAFRGDAIYVGCGAGIGRTGTYLAAVLKVFFPHSDPVALVREQYLSYAVETKDQEQLLANFDVTAIRAKLFWWALQARLGLLK